MAFGALCDRCGEDLLGRDLRYHLTLEIAQAYDPMEVTSVDLARDLRGELEAEIKLLEALPAKQMKELEEEVFSSFRFDLCADCARALRKEAKGFFGKILQKGEPAAEGPRADGTGADPEATEEGEGGAGGPARPPADR